MEDGPLLAAPWEVLTVAAVGRRNPRQKFKQTIMEEV
jgi:hypothetical protein